MQGHEHSSAFICVHLRFQYLRASTSLERGLHLCQERLPADAEILRPIARIPFLEFLCAERSQLAQAPRLLQEPAGQRRDAAVDGGHPDGGQVLVVHYRDIERRFLDAALHARIGEGLQFPVIDTMDLEARMHRGHKPGLVDRVLGRKPPWVSIRLGDSRKRYGLPRYQPHHAMTDALASAELLLAQVAHHYAPDTPVRDLWQ